MIKALAITAALAVTLILFVTISGSKFRQRVDRDKAMVVDADNRSVAKRSYRWGLDPLPEPVSKYFAYALGKDRRSILNVRIEQEGEFRMPEKNNWITLSANQQVAVNVPAFVWHARIQPHPYFWTEGRDMLYQGSARVEQRFYSAVPLQFEAGKEADLSALVRYLAEAPWYPTALLPSDSLVWKSIDHLNARAIKTHSGYQVSVVFTFNESGAIIKATTEDRYRTNNHAKAKVPWTMRYKNYEDHGGVRLPMLVEAEWNLPAGSFPYWKIRVRNISFDRL